MGRIEFPNTPINAAPQETAGVEHAGFVQPPLEGLEAEQPPEIELGNCTVTSPVRFRKLMKGNEWQCSISVAPDLLHPEQEGEFEVHAFDRFADMAHRYHLRPGDRALMRGTMQQQPIAFENGETMIVSHFFVTAIEMLSRSKRTSMTVYEQGKK